MRNDISLDGHPVPCSLLGVGAALPPTLHPASHRKTLQCRHRERRCGAAILEVWGAVDPMGVLALDFVLACSQENQQARSRSTQPT